MGERDRNVPDLLNEAHSLLGGKNYVKYVLIH